MYKKGAGNDKQGKDAGNRTLCPYRNFSQAINYHSRTAKVNFCWIWWTDSTHGHIIRHLKANGVLFTILSDAEHQNGAVIRKRLFKIRYLEIYWGCVVWLKFGHIWSNAILKTDTTSWKGVWQDEQKRRKNQGDQILVYWDIALQSFQMCWHQHLLQIFKHKMDQRHFCHNLV